MRAKLIIEGIEDILKPKDFEEIALNLKIEKNDPNFWNKVLIAAVEKDQSALIKLALDNGANQLWWESGGPMGGYHGLTADLISSIYRISAIKGAIGDWRGFHQKTNFKIIYISLASINWKTKEWYLHDSPSIATSQLFSKKFSPLDEHLIKRLENIRDKAQKTLLFIKKIE